MTRPLLDGRARRRCPTRGSRADADEAPDDVRGRYVDQLLARLAARDAWLPGAGGGRRGRAGRPPPGAARGEPAGLAGAAATGGGDPAVRDDASSTPCCAWCRGWSAVRRSTPASWSTAGSATTSAPGCTWTSTGCAPWTRPRTPTAIGRALQAAADVCAAAPAAGAAGREALGLAVPLADRAAQHRRPAGPGAHRPDRRPRRRGRPPAAAAGAAGRGLTRRRARGTPPSPARTATGSTCSARSGPSRAGRRSGGRARGRGR